MYISYSGDKKFDNCQFAYWNEYPNKTPKTGPDDRLGSIYGSSVGKLFEDFYVLKLWRDPDPKGRLLARVSQTVDAVIKQETTDKFSRKGGVLLWRGEDVGQNPKGLYANREELEEDVREAIPRGLNSIKLHRLVGPRADAEYKLDFKTPDGHTLAGRADFIIERVPPFKDLVVVDGKGSRHRDAYVDPQQLIWYSMLFYLHSVQAGSPRVPDKAAFLFWRYPPEKSVDWVSVSESDVKRLLEATLENIRTIEEKLRLLPAKASLDIVRGVFRPKASESNCRYCPYAAHCPPGYKVQEDLKCRQR